MAWLDDDGTPFDRQKSFEFTDDDAVNSVAVVTFTPEECGWVRVGPRTWETPDGMLYIFPPHGPELIMKLKGGG